MFVFFFGNSPTFKKKRKESKETMRGEEEGGFGQYDIALYIYGVHQLHKYGSNTE